MPENTVFSELLSIFPLLGGPVAGEAAGLWERGRSEMGALSTALEWDIRSGRGGHKQEGQSGHGL